MNDPWLFPRRVRPRVSDEEPAQKSEEAAPLALLVTVLPQVIPALTKEEYLRIFAPEELNEKKSFTR